MRINWTLAAFALIAGSITIAGCTRRTEEVATTRAAARAVAAPLIPRCAIFANRARAPDWISPYARQFI